MGIYWSLCISHVQLIALKGVKGWHISLQWRLSQLWAVKEKPKSSAGKKKWMRMKNLTFCRPGPGKDDFSSCQISPSKWFHCYCLSCIFVLALYMKFWLNFYCLSNNTRHRGPMVEPTNNYSKWHCRVNYTQKCYVVDPTLINRTFLALIIFQGHKIEKCPRPP